MDVAKGQIDRAWMEVVLGETTVSSAWLSGLIRARPARDVDAVSE